MLSTLLQSSQMQRSCEPADHFLTVSDTPEGDTKLHYEHMTKEVLEIEFNSVFGQIDPS